MIPSQSSHGRSAIPSQPSHDRDMAPSRRRRVAPDEVAAPGQKRRRRFGAHRRGNVELALTRGCEEAQTMDAPEPETALFLTR